ncbi:MAG: ASKHA domain-containing protein [Bacillota bacterium]
MNDEAAGKEIRIIIKDGKSIPAKTGRTVLDALTAAGIVLEANCGGRGKCGKCKIKVLSGQVADSSGQPAAPGEDGTYLACQVYPGEDLVVDKIEQAEASFKGEIGRLTPGGGESVSPVKKILVKPVYPTLENNYSLQEMIRRAAGEKAPVCPNALKELALVASRKAKTVTLTVVSPEITAVEAGDTTAALYGVAFDIGTTTVAGMLVDVNRGGVVAAAAKTNPQASFGADVISRIVAAEKPDGLRRLASAVRECLNGIIERLCQTAGISNRDIYLITVAGNSTMEHLLMEIPPRSLAQSPYVPVFKYLPQFPPGELGLNINPGGRIVLLPIIGGFVGADTVAAVVAVDQDLTEKMVLLIDLGTNGELVLGNKNGLVVTSTAAGPAFEGAQLSCGMRAAEGAIDNVAVDGDVRYTTIGNERPKGICGSGVVKALAELLKAGIITPSGKFTDDPGAAVFPHLAKERLRKRNGRMEFVLAFGEETGTGRDITITQGDIREIQLVKSSICTGAQVLMETLGLTPGQVDEVLVAGAFGNFIDIDSALAIGLIPVTDRRKIRPVGNAAGTGAVKAILTREHLDRCSRVAEKAVLIELANQPEFQRRFLGNLPFPEVTKQ